MSGKNGMGLSGKRLPKRVLPALVALVLLAGVVATAARTISASEPTRVKGTVTISGAWALYPMVVKWAEEFRKLNPQVRIDVSAGGAGKGMADTLAGAVDIGMVSRDIFPEEVQKGAFAVAVAKDAVFATINEKNPYAEELLKKGVRRESFIGIWITEKVSDWKQVVQGNRSYPIHVYTRSDAAGAPETWANYLGKKQEDLKGIAVYGDPGVAEAVRKDPLGIGFNNLNYAFDFKTGLPVAGLKVLPIDANGNGKVDEGEDVSTKEKAVDAVASGKYPSPPARALYLVTKGKPSGATKAFIIWILTEAQKYLDDVGYIALSRGLLQDGLESLR